MDVTARGSKTYIKVDSLEPPDENESREMETVQLQDVTLNSAEKQDQLDVQVITDDGDADSTKGKGKCMEKCGWLVGVLVVVSVLVGILSVVFDWLWVYDMAMAEQALVFGPPRTGVFVTLCIVASLGTVTFLGESIDKLKKFITGTEWFDEETEELASLFLEEVPEITLNMLLAMCREVPTSYFQLVKALLVIVSSGLRLVKGLLYLLGCRKDKKSKRRLRFGGWILLMVACVYTFSAAICVFVFMYQPPPGNPGDKKFHVPEYVMGKHYNTERYFPNAGVFFSHPSLDHCDHSRYPTPHRRRSDHKSWFLVASIYSFMSLGLSSLEAAYAYNDSTAAFWVKSPHSQECFTTTLSDCSITRTNISDCELMTNPKILFFTFVHSPKSKTLVFGDIQFNASVITNWDCDYLTTDPYGQLYQGSQYQGQLHYFKADSNVDTSSSVTEEGDRLRFYQYPQDMTNVTEAWKTGHRKCTMTGTIAPTANDRISSKCVFKFGENTQGG